VKLKHKNIFYNPINLVRKGMPILIICNIWGKINLPEVARKNITAPKIKMKINFLYISG